MNAYKCYYEDCSRIYNSKYNLIRHINSYHLDNKSYMCSYCNKSFYNKQCLDVHIFSSVCEEKLSVEKFGIMQDISRITDAVPLRLKRTPSLMLPILPRIEKERQVPLCLAKLPIISILFEDASIYR